MQVTSSTSTIPTAAASALAAATPTSGTSGTTASGSSSSNATSNSSSSNATSNSSSSNASASAASATVNYNSFLQLLVAELQNQDPTNPTDPTQYMSQLASFSSVGQAIQTNQLLTTMLTNNALQQADSAIGRTVTSADGTISGKVSSVSIGSSGTVTATLANGQTLALGSGVTIS